MRDPGTIVRQQDYNNFFVNFQQTKAIEEIQTRSGMDGPYSVEYQAHFSSMVGKLETEGQTMNLIIPMAFINYHQEVGGASVEFNLTEVSEATNDANDTIMKKAEEFQQTDMYKALVDMGITSWEIVHLMTSHVHPQNIDRFSGTDYSADVNHPGVCWPLSTGTNVPSISMIMQHKSNKLEIVHTE